MVGGGFRSLLLSSRAIPVAAITAAVASEERTAAMRMRFMRMTSWGSSDAAAKDPPGA
jgi:hypothetical protein